MGLQWYVAGDWILTVCAKSTALDFDIEDINISTVDTGEDNNYLAGFSDATRFF
jgi:hypothetical protein